MRNQIVTCLLIGAALGCVAGAMSERRDVSTSTRDAKPYVVSVNQRTGKPQLHVQGKPEIE